MCSRSAIAVALRSGRTLKPMMTAFDAAAKTTSPSLMAPAPLLSSRTRTRSSPSLLRASASTSAEPWTSALTMMGSSRASPSAICCWSDSRVRRPPFSPSVFSLAWPCRSIAICRAFAASATAWKVSPGCGSPVSPRTSIGLDGPASSCFWPRSSMRARTLPTIGPAMKLSPTRSVPSLTRIVATGPRPRSILASSTVPPALRFGLAFSSATSVTSRIISSSESRFCCCFADTSTVTVEPPQSSGVSPSSDSSVLTRSEFAFALSILLMATMRGTSAALAWSIASRVWGMTPSSAATTRTTMSVTRAPRARIRVNAS